MIKLPELDPSKSSFQSDLFKNMAWTILPYAKKEFQNYASGAGERASYNAERIRLAKLLMSSLGSDARQRMLNQYTNRARSNAQITAKRNAALLRPSLGANAYDTAMLDAENRALSDINQYQGGLYHPDYISEQYAKKAQALGLMKPEYDFNALNFLGQFGSQIPPPEPKKSGGGLLGSILGTVAGFAIPGIAGKIKW